MTVKQFYLVLDDSVRVIIKKDGEKYFEGFLGDCGLDKLMRSFIKNVIPINEKVLLICIW